METRNGLKAYRGLSSRAYVSGERCQNPICRKPFPQTGLTIQPRRHCSEQCRYTASVIRRAARLLVGVPKTEILEWVMGKRSKLSPETLQNR